MLAPANAELKWVSDGLKVTTVVSYSILRVKEPIFVKLVSVTGAVKVAPGQTVYVPIAVFGALVAVTLNGRQKIPDIRKKIKKVRPLTIKINTGRIND